MRLDIDTDVYLRSLESSDAERIFQLVDQFLSSGIQAHRHRIHCVLCDSILFVFSVCLKLARVWHYACIFDFVPVHMEILHFLIVLSHSFTIWFICVVL